MLEKIAAIFRSCLELGDGIDCCSQRGINFSLRERRQLVEEECF